MSPHAAWSFYMAETVKLPLTGGCLCGECRYELSAAPYFAYVCHCTDCQTQSGSAFNMSMPAPRAALKIVKGAPAVFRRQMPGDRLSEVNFCGTCASRLFALSSESVAVLRVGTLDDTSWVFPAVQNFVRSAHSWAILPGVPQLETQAENYDEYRRAWRKAAPRFE